MEIRQATSADAQSIAEVEIRSRLAGYASFMPLDYLEALSIEYAASLWEARLMERHLVTAVAEADGRVAGFVRYGEADAPDKGGNTGEVHLMFVHPDCWRQGIGTALLQEAEAGLLRRGFVAAVLSVYEENEQARRFYEHQGWAFDGTSWPVERAGVQLTHFRYARDLAPR
jgi:ribosomal protein S18 acetylase RimI-like enzyme